MDLPKKRGEPSKSKSSKPKSKSTKSKKKGRQDSDSESETESGSESSEESGSNSEEESKEAARKRASKTTVPSKKKSTIAVKNEDTDKGKTDRQTIEDLTQKMDKLSISSPQYRTYFVQLALINKDISALYATPEVVAPRSYASLDVHPSTSERADSSLRGSMRSRENRNGEPSGERKCYGCGENGHRLSKCVKVEAFLDQNIIKRVAGKLRWADGSPIIRKFDDTWIQAIKQKIQDDKKSTDNNEPRVYYLEVSREESDDDTDAQESLGWRSGTSSVGHVHAYGAERNNKISKNTRKDVQRNVPQGAHQVEKLAGTSHLKRSEGKGPTIQGDLSLNKGKDRSRATEAVTLTPFDVAHDKFEGKADEELLPMDIDEGVREEVSKDRRKSVTRDTKRSSREVVQRRTEKVNQRLIERLLNSDITLSAKDLARMSREWHRDLIGAVKSIHKDSEEDAEPEKPRKISREAFRESRALRAAGGEPNPYKSLAKYPLLDVTIGELTVKAVIDTGSMVNMISSIMAEESGLPTSPVPKSKQLTVRGITGSGLTCKEWIPDAVIYVSAAKKPTAGALFVMEGADFELILGMPWIDDHMVAMVRRERGLYISWDSGDNRYEIKAYRTKTEPVEQARIVSQGDSDAEESEEPTSYVARFQQGPRTDVSYVPDSEEDRLRIDYRGRQNTSDDEDIDMAPIDWARNQIANWKRTWEPNEGDADVEDAEEAEGNDGSRRGKRETSPPPTDQFLAKGKWKAATKRVAEDDANARSKKKRRTKQRSERIIEVTEEMEDEFVPEVNDEIEEQEWKAFLGRESKRKTENNRAWYKWLEDEGEEGTTQGSEENEDVPIADESPHSSEKEERLTEEKKGRKRGISTFLQPRTLEDGPAKSTRSATQARQAEATQSMRQATLRRSQRLQHTTGSTKPDNKVRTYRRHEKTSHEVVTRTQSAARRDQGGKKGKGIQVRAYCTHFVANAAKSDREEETEERSQYSRQKTKTRKPHSNREEVLVERKHYPLRQIFGLARGSRQATNVPHPHS